MKTKEKKTLTLVFPTPLSAVGEMRGRYAPLGPSGSGVSLLRLDRSADGASKSDKMDPSFSSASEMPSPVALLYQAN